MEAVIADVESCDVDEVLVGGDLVGRGPEGSRVARRIRELGWPGVRGNHEDYLVSFRRGEVPPEWIEAEEWSAARFMAADLDDRDESYLRELPLRIDSAIAPEVTLVHGSPRSHSEGLGPWSHDEQLVEHLHDVDGGVLLCAHTHRPMVRRLASGTVVNVGAVGLPFNGDIRAQYALLHVGGGELKIELRRVPYDLDRIVDIYERSGFLEQGGATSRLLLMELRRARPFLVPFIKWIEKTGRPNRVEEIDAFLERYVPDALP